MLIRTFVFLLPISTAPLMLAQVADEQELNRRRVHSGKVRQRQEEFYRMRAYPGGHIPSGARAAAVHEMESMMARERMQSPLASSQRWTLIGPRPTNGNPESGQAGPPFSSGKVSALAVHPTNASIVYLGASDGGVWKTSDGGQNWTPLTDDQPSLATGPIPIAPSSPNTVYVGTGEQNNAANS